MPEVVFHPEARRELVEAIVFLEGRRPGVGLRLEAETAAVVSRVFDFPESGSALAGYPQGLAVSSHQLPSFPYALIATRIEDLILIVAVAHQSRRPGYWRKRLK